MDIIINLHDFRGLQDNRNLFEIVMGKWAMDLIMKRSNESLSIETWHHVSHSVGGEKGLLCSSSTASCKRPFRTWPSTKPTSEQLWKVRTNSLAGRWNCWNILHRNKVYPKREPPLSYIFEGVRKWRLVPEVASELELRCVRGEKIQRFKATRDEPRASSEPLRRPCRDQDTPRSEPASVHGGWNRQSGMTQFSHRSFAASFPASRGRREEFGLGENWGREKWELSG